MATATEEKPAAPVTVREDNSRMPNPLPKVGDTVWYALPFGPLVEYRPAKVTEDGVEKDKDGKFLKLEAPDSDDGGRLHLAVSVVKSRHHSAKDIAYRYNAPWGPGKSHWLLYKPAGADADFEEQKQRQAMKDDINRERMRTDQAKV